MSVEATLREPYYTAVADGRKTIEIRVKKGKWAEVKIGTVIKFTSTEDSKLSTEKKVSKIEEYKSFRDCLETHLAQALPNDVLSKDCRNWVDDGVRLYYAIYSVDDEKNGVVAIHLE